MEYKDFEQAVHKEESDPYIVIRLFRKDSDKVFYGQGKNLADFYHAAKYQTIEEANRLARLVIEDHDTAYFRYYNKDLADNLLAYEILLVRKYVEESHLEMITQYELKVLEKYTPVCGSNHE